MAVIKISELPQVLSLGNQSEQGKSIQFDVSEWDALYPGARYEITYIRPGETGSWPAMGVNHSNGALTWVVSRSVTLKAGQGSFVIHCYVDEDEKNTGEAWYFIGGGHEIGETPDAVAEWLAETNAAEALRETAETARETAEGLRDTAEGLRAGAEISRNTAEGLRLSAEISRNTAEGLRDDAETAREEAEALRVEAEATRMGFKPMGAYNPANENKYGEWYTHEGGSYGYIWPEPSTGVPLSDTTHWQRIASVGGQDLVDAAVAARDAAQGYKDDAANFAAQLAAGVASPAGTYANLAALNADIANVDTDRIYVTEDDGKWCYYDVGTSLYKSGAVFQTLVDTTFAVAGHAADAKAVGDKFVEGSVMSVSNGTDVGIFPVPESRIFPTITITPVQSGTGAPSPSNVRPFIGFNTIGIRVSGKNMFKYLPRGNTGYDLSAWVGSGTMDEEYATGAKVTGNTGGTPGTISYSNGWFQPAKESVSGIGPYVKEAYVTVSVDATLIDGYNGATSMSVRIMLHQQDDTYAAVRTYQQDTHTLAEGVKQRISTTFIVSKDYAQAVRPVFTLNSSTILYENIQIEIGETASPYETYVGNVYTVALPETLYGLELDASSGVLKKTHEYIASYDGETVPDGWKSSTGELVTGVKVTYPLEDYEELSTTPIIAITIHQTNLYTPVENFVSASAETLSLIYAKSLIKSDNDNSAFVGEVEPERLVKAIPGKNLYNPDSDAPGKLDTAVGGYIKINLLTSLYYQKIAVDPSNDYTLFGINQYAFTDAFDKIVGSIMQSNSITAHTLTDIDPSVENLWVSIDKARDFHTQIEVGDSPTAYEPYNPIASLISGDYEFTPGVVVDTNKSAVGVWSSQKTSNEDGVSIEYAKRQADGRVKELEMIVAKLSKNISRLSNVTMDKAIDTQTITPNSTAAQKLILHLHKRANSGYDTKNDVYLPHAEDDFSDVVIKDSAGNVLPYRVNCLSDIDVIADARLGVGDTMSNGFRKDIDDNLYRYPGEISSDGGVTWTKLSAVLDPLGSVDIIAVDSDKTVFLDYKGKVYRSEYPYSTYALVLDTSVGYTSSTGSLVIHPDGECFYGAYQVEFAPRVYKSTDKGLTWTLILSGVGGQHVHDIHIDTHVTPVAVYVGIDATFDVWKTTDKGANWTNLRAVNPDMPLATDHGVIYSDTGYRLLGGETYFVGGHCVLKTTDDLTYTTPYKTSNGFYCADKINGHLIAGLVGSETTRCGRVIYSDDDGETWNHLYQSSPLMDSEGASDGYRRMINYTVDGDEQLIIAARSAGRSPLRVFSDAATRYAEIIVDVPEDSGDLTVSSGGVYTYETEIWNTFKASNEEVVAFDFNGGGRLVQERISHSVYSSDDYEWVESGRHLSYIHPYITSPIDKYALKAKSLSGGFEVAFSLSPEDSFTISFWAKIGGDFSGDLFRLESGAYAAAQIVGGGGLYFNNGITNTSIIWFGIPITPGELIKYDLVYNYATGRILVYRNGIFFEETASAKDAAISAFMTLFTGTQTFTLLDLTSTSEEDCIQHFMIRRGVVSADDLFAEFNDGLRDNMET